MAFSAKVLADSINQGNRLTTFELTFPRVILAEFNTHRMISRNAASSRAIPTAKLIQRVKDDPFIPEFRLNQKGMQAGEALEDNAADRAKDSWLQARDNAVSSATGMHLLDCHKQYVNRLLEPWMWCTVIVSATEWNNLFHLRCSPQAEPSFQKVATMAYEAMVASVPRILEPGDWHKPMADDPETWDEVARYLDSIDYQDAVEPTRVTEDLVEEYMVKVSVGRCARVSYETHNGKRDVVEDIRLHDTLLKNGHWSPFEHPAMAQETPAQSGNFFGFDQYRKDHSNENVLTYDPRENN